MVHFRKHRKSTDEEYYLYAVAILPGIHKLEMGF